MLSTQVQEKRAGSHHGQLWHLLQIKCSARLDTCMQDSSIRLWNLETRVCVAIFQGLQLESTGHESEVLSLVWSCCY